MKANTLLVILLAISLVGLGYHVSVHKPSKPVKTDMPDSKGLLTVKQVSEHPDGFTGQIEVLGVVSQTEKDQALIGLVDKPEGLSCPTGQCSSCVLPVSWDGLMPKVGEKIIVTGRIEKSPEGLVVVASQVDKQ